MAKRIPFVIFLCIAAMALAQAPKEFDVAAIRLNTDPGEYWSVRTPPGGRYTARHITVQTLIVNTLKIKEFQLEGAPRWLDSERYDIDAKADLTTREFGGRAGAPDAESAGLALRSGLPPRNERSPGLFTGSREKRREASSKHRRAGRNRLGQGPYQRDSPYPGGFGGCARSAIGQSRQERHRN